MWTEDRVSLAVMLAVIAAITAVVYVANQQINAEAGDRVTLSKKCGNVNDFTVTRDGAVVHLLHGTSTDEVKVPAKLSWRLEVDKLFVFEYNKENQLVAFGPVDACN